MNKDLKVYKRIEINASAEKVWGVFTNPEKIKMYLYGTQTTASWKVGTPIIFKGEYNGISYQDKGNVLQNTPLELLQYNYWSSFTGLEDKEENNFIVSYIIEKVTEKK